MRKPYYYTIKCEKCGTLKRTTRNTQKYCSRSCIPYPIMRGDKNPNWRGGLNVKNRGIKGKLQAQMCKWRKEVLSRSGGKCVVCGSVEKVEAHHIIPLRETYATATMPMNGVALCRKHHNEFDPHKCGAKSKVRGLHKLTRSRAVVRMVHIPANFMEYETAGNWSWDSSGGLAVFVAEEMEDESIFLVKLHEFVEAVLCKYQGVRELDVTNFDKSYEASRSLGIAPCGCNHYEEPGDDPHCPYKHQHAVAESYEKMLADELGVDWKQHNGNI